MLRSRLAPLTLAVHGLEKPSAQEFVEHPDFRQICAFFLGWVFFCSLHYIAVSPFLRSVISLVTQRLANKHAKFDPEARPTSLTDEKEKSIIAWRRDSEASEYVEPNLLSLKRDNHILTFTLSLCLAFASVAQFASLLAFSGKGGASCAFVVAWGGVANQLARLVGLLTVILELRQLGIARYEDILCWTWISVGLVFVFVTNAISTGAVQQVPFLPHTFLCYRRHFLPTSIVSSLVYLSLEIYITIRSFLHVSEPKDRSWQDLADTQVLRGLSLMFLELLTIGPSAAPTTLVGDFVPFSIGAIAVLVAFNHHHTRASEIPVIVSQPQSKGVGRNSRPSTYLKPSPSHSVHSINLKIGQPYFPHHPFANPGFNDDHDDDPAPMSPMTARTSLTIDSAMEKSVKNAVIGKASRISKIPDVPARMHHAPGRSTLELITVPQPTRKSSAAELGDGPWRHTQSLFSGSRLPQQDGQGTSSARPTHRRDPSRKIVQDQVQLAEHLEQQLEERVSSTPTGPVPPPARPRIETPRVETTFTSLSESQPLSPHSTTTMNSAIYGSDIVRFTSKVDKTKRPSRSLRRLVSRSSMTPSSSEGSSTTVSPTNRRPVSLVSTAASHIKESLPAVVEGEQQPPAGRSRAPTFGEAAFRRAGYGSSLAAIMGNDSGPMPPSRQLLRPPSRLIRGPRLPPPVAGGRDNLSRTVASDSRSPLTRIPILASFEPESSVVSPPLSGSTSTPSTQPV
ncbi:hypothetical protein PUNSTDRAFT_119569 [Punctularia strigosozonata HHB-11173 SS5]|uniref:uncharacterized protein n=1 Tax=Punctularia strigosozonata (strain HHB-11173) TaxID=741275 RepID=UPI0004416C09|nr:uncharacterized protein PUNSTDRAFT_119569 [Punctularia strigosozonata HHB-11173 SS5]EIN10653.1 hypothetical protein PUNSTDRAFT_119569 [Punctularia strigosozonata HHB-11173 SS5]